MLPNGSQPAVLIYTWTLLCLIKCNNQTEAKSDLQRIHKPLGVEIICRNSILTASLLCQNDQKDIQTASNIQRTTKEKDFSAVTTASYCAELVPSTCKTIEKSLFPRPPSTRNHPQRVNKTRWLSQLVLNTKPSSWLLKTFIPVLDLVLPWISHIYWPFHQKENFLSEVQFIVLSSLRAVARPSSSEWCWLTVWPIQGSALLPGSSGLVGCRGIRSPLPQQCRLGRWHYKACWSLESAGWPAEVLCRRAWSNWTPLYTGNWREIGNLIILLSRQMCFSTETLTHSNL